MVQVHPPLPSPIPHTTATLDQALRRLLAGETPCAAERWSIAFSGGPDSLALTIGLQPLAHAVGLDLHLVHVDHGLDAESAARARRAAELAARLHLPIEVRRVDVPSLRHRRESPEAAARRLRYRELESSRSELGATRILTAHHRDDLVETVLLQILRGAPPEGVGGIRARRGAIRRPLLGVSRRDLEERIATSGLVPVEDPTNSDLGVPRNRLRHRLLPRLRALEPEIDDSLLALSRRSRALLRRLDRTFTERLEEASASEDEAAHRTGRPETSATPARLTQRPGSQHRSDSAALARLLETLPAPLRSAALRWLLHERIGVTRLPSSASLEDFGRAACTRRSARLRLRNARQELVFLPEEGISVGTPEPRTPPFSYTFSIPGEVELPELGLRLRIRRTGLEAWMLQGDPRRAGFRTEANAATVRNRRPGDRIRPLGAPGERKLKELLIDRRIPAAERDRLPLVEIDSRIAWVPGVALDEAYRLDPAGACWLAELEPMATARP